MRRLASRFAYSVKLSLVLTIALIFPHARLTRAEPLFPYPFGCTSGSGCRLAGDMDEDGRPDLLSSDPSLGKIYVSLNNGDATFTRQTVASVTSLGSVLGVGDFNGDGHQDVLISNGNSITPAVAVLFGAGDGSLSTPTAFSPADSVYGSVVGDFNGDGRDDVAVLNAATHVGVLVLLSNGDGTFTASSAGLDSYPQDLLEGDFDGDQRTDLAMQVPPTFTQPPGFNISQVRVLFGAGDGTFSRTTLFPVADGPIRIATGEVDGDGRPDIAATVQYTGSVMTFYAKADGTFTLGATVGPSQGLTSPDNLSVGDLNGDGRGDLIVNDATATHLLGNDGRGSFVLIDSFPYRSLEYQLAKLNGDSALDVLLNGLVLLGKGDGTLVRGIHSPMTQCPTSVVTGHFNSDAQLDIAVTAYCPPFPNPPPMPPTQAFGLVEIFLGDGHGAFGASYAWSTADQASDAAVADFNRDGRQDVAVTHALSNDVSVHFGNGDGTLADPVRYPAGSGPLAIVAVDFNVDGWLDLAVANSLSDDVSILLNNGDGTFAPQARFAAGSGPAALASGDFDGNGFRTLSL